MDWEKPLVISLYIRDITMIIKNMERESVFGEMEQDARLLFIQEILREKSLISLLMVKSTMERPKIKKYMEKED